MPADDRAVSPTGNVRRAPNSPRRRGRLAGSGRAARAERARVVLSRLKAALPRRPLRARHRNAYELLSRDHSLGPVHRRPGEHGDADALRPVSRPFELARARPGDVEEIIKSTGFFRNKTKSLIGMAQAVVADHGGEVPRTMEELRELPGVGRKTANVVLGNAYGINEGVTVDTHVTRLEPPAGPDPGRRSGQDRAGPDAAVPPGRLGPALAPADLPRPAGLHRPAAPLRRVRAGRLCPSAVL